MKRIWPKLQPPFLKKLDNWLLKWHPYIWRTQFHYFFFWGLSLAFVFFLAGLMLPQNGKILRVDPINLVLIHKESIFFMVGLVLPIIYWAYLQYKKGLPRLNATNSLITLLCYFIGSFVLFGVTAPAFRLGNIFHAAYFLMDKSDIREIKENDYYAYGMLFLKEDSVAVEPADSFFDYREMLFRRLIRREDSLLTFRYRFDDEIIPKFFPDSSKEEYKKDRKYLPNSIYPKALGRRSVCFLSHAIDPIDDSYKSLWSYLDMRINDHNYWELVVFNSDTINNPYQFVAPVILDDPYSYMMGLVEEKTKAGLILLENWVVDTLYKQFLFDNWYLSFISDISAYASDKFNTAQRLGMGADFIYLPSSYLEDLLPRLNQSYLTGQSYLSAPSIDLNYQSFYLSAGNWSGSNSVSAYEYQDYITDLTNYFFLNEDFSYQKNEYPPMDEFLKKRSNPGLYYSNLPEIIYPRYYYDFYRKRMNREKLQLLFQKYKILISSKYISEGSSLALDLFYLSRLEEMVRSVDHAKLYLHKGVISLHWKLLLPYLFGISIFLFISPCLRFLWLFGTSLLNGMIIGGGISFLGAWRADGFLEKLNYVSLSDLTFYVPFLLYFIFALSLIFRQQKTGILEFSVHSVCCIILFIIVLTFLEEDPGWDDYVPLGYSLWSLIILGVVYCFLLGYIQGYPKKKMA